jgi:hypothetical protein
MRGMRILTFECVDTECVIVEVIVAKKFGNVFFGTYWENVQFTKHFGIDIGLWFELEDPSTSEFFEMAIQ